MGPGHREGPVVDGRGHAIVLPRPPSRIVSLVPSATETLFDLGAAHRVVGVTKWCVSPRPWVDGMPKVGGTKDVDIDAVRRLSPDLVVGNCEENTREIFEALEAFVPVYAPFPRTVDQAIEDVASLSRLLGLAQAGEDWMARIRSARAALRPRSFRFLYLIWRKPWMAVNDDTFIAAMLREAGGRNVVARHSDRFPALEPGEISDAALDVILLSSEPMPFGEAHADELAQQTGLPRDRIRFIDGAHCSWHGTRMARAFAYLQACLEAGFPERPGG